MGKAQAESDISGAAMLPHYNMWDPEHEKAKWDVFSYARRNCPVAHTDADGGGQYVVTRYDDVRRVLEDPQTFSSTGVAPRPSPVRLNPLDADPPYQVELRKILNPLFTRSFLLRFEPELRRNATDLIGRFIDDGRVEFVREFAGPFVGNALSRVVFNEDDPEKMDHAAEVVIRVAVEATDEAFFELAVLAGQYIAEREANPVARNDVLNAIATGTVEGGRPLTDEERLGVITVLFLGGLDTTRGAMGSIAYHLAGRPELEQRLRDPAWIRQDMDEFIRLESPVGCLGRTATRDVELGGVTIRQGQQLLIRFDSANRDEARFGDASCLKFDVRRSSSAGFGLGIHRCLGSHFARIQIAIAFDELFNRVTNLRFADPAAEVHWAPGIANGPERLDLLFDVID
jgi:cytochrome P450